MPADKISLKVVTPEREIVSLDVDEVTLPSVDGYMGVLPGHAPLLARLDVGEVTYRSGREQSYFAVSGGIAEVLGGSVQILAETCEAADEIDLDRAQRARDRAKKKLDADVAELDFRRAEVSLKKAISRIHVHERTH